jgi:hypothetical protein
MACDDIVYDIEGHTDVRYGFIIMECHVIHVGFDIGYDIALSHPHVDFEQPAPSPTAGSRNCCSFLWDLTPEAARNYID